jgi:hypothetical protein
MTENEPVKLWDHFSFNGQLEVANIQPQYGLIHLNYWRRGELQSSADVKVDAFFEALETLFDVTITPNTKADQ